MARTKEKDPAPQLPRLTFEEAAKVLGITRAEFLLWLDHDWKVDVESLGKWTRGVRPITEKMIRAYLSWKLDPSIVTRPAPPEPSSSVAPTAKERGSVQRGKQRQRKKAATGRETRNNTAR